MSTAHTRTKKTKGLPNSIDAHVGKRLRRCLLGFSQEKLGKIVGLTFQQIQKYEKGINRITAGRLYQFSKVLGVPVGYFYENMDAEAELALPAQYRGKTVKSEANQIDYNLLQNKEIITLIKTYASFEDDHLRKESIKHFKIVADLSRKKNPKKNN